MTTRIIKNFIKTILVYLVLSIFFIFPVKAEGEFLVDTSVEYKVQNNGITQVTHSITLENVLSNIYATSYKLRLENINADNIKAYDNKGLLDSQTEIEADRITIKVNFDDAVVGKGQKRYFNISYNVSSFAQKTGEVWEISVPRLSDENSYKNYSVTLLIPDGFKSEAYMSPQPNYSGHVEGYKTFTFSKESVSKTGIAAGFGDFQVFSFNLIYHLENPLSKSVFVDIAVPPDTSLQRVFYEVFSPEPHNVNVDEDGNWIASFLLKSRERKDVTLKGTVQIFSDPMKFPRPTDSTLAKNILPTQYWQTDNSKIKELALIYNTPRKIYDYVSSFLKYNYEKVKPNVVRMGALSALEDPGNAICMEFTDLFIAMARAAGIPAREINGFAYTENKEIQPLSLVADVLHSWPEYWDKEKGDWIPIDPTWASTTGGVDFFNKLDLRHFTFVIHGIDDVKPYPPGSYKLGANPQKDVFVNFGTLPENRNAKISLSYKKDKYIPFAKQNISVFVKNEGVQSEYNVIVNTISDDKPTEDINIGTIPPFAQREFNVTTPFSFLAANTPKNIIVVYKDQKIVIPTSKKEVIVLNLLIILIIFAIFTFLLLVRLGKIKV
ncbi:MAG: transglutaminase-like domain-containing protein [bacterium]